MASPVVAAGIKAAKKVLIDLITEPEKAKKTVILVLTVPLCAILIFFALPIVIATNVPSISISPLYNTPAEADYVNKLLGYYQSASGYISEENNNWINTKKQEYKNYDDIVVKNSFILTWQQLMALDAAITKQSFENLSLSTILENARRFVKREVATETYIEYITSFLELGDGVYSKDRKKVNTDYKFVLSFSDIKQYNIGDKFYVKDKGLYKVADNNYVELGSGVYTGANKKSSIKVVSVLPNANSNSVLPGYYYYVNNGGFFRVIEVKIYSVISKKDVMVKRYELISDNKPSELSSINIYESYSDFPDKNSFKKDTILYAIKENKSYNCSTNKFVQLTTPSELSGILIYDDYNKLSLANVSKGTVIYCIKQNKSYVKGEKAVEKKRAILTIKMRPYEDILNELKLDDDSKEFAKNILENLADINLESSFNIYDDLNMADLKEYPAGNANIPYYNQTDKRWGNESYGNNIIAASGCGPTSLAMVAAGLTANTNITPKTVADWSVANGYRVEGVGSAWDLMPKGGAHYGLKVEAVSRTNGNKILQALSSGKPVIASMGRGHFTNNGHFIVLRGLDRDGKVLVYDPASYERSQKSWDIGIIMNESSTNGGISGSPFWIFSKK